MEKCDTVYNGGDRVVSCKECGIYLTNYCEMISNRFQGGTGKAYLYYRVWNIRCLEKQQRDMMTGKHVVRDIVCLRCGAKLGWMYEYAMEESQKYKEMRVILEKALISEEEGIHDPEYGYDGPFPLKDNHHRGSPESQLIAEPTETLQHINLTQKKKR